MSNASKPTTVEGALPAAQLARAAERILRTGPGALELRTHRPRRRASGRSAGGSADTPIIIWCACAVVIRDVEIDLVRRLVHVGRQQVALTPRQFVLFTHLASAHGKIVCYEELADRLGSNGQRSIRVEYDRARDAVRPHIRALRRRFAPLPPCPAVIIETVSREGYRLHFRRAESPLG